jgi:Uma2 family endonuclease
MSIAESTHDELTEEMIERVKAELVETDGEPLETPWHRAEINLLIDQTRSHRGEQTDYFVGGNMFVYFSRQQARKREYRGPDYFFVKGVDGTRKRDYWWVFEEDSRFPDVIIELLSPSTATEDRTTKKDLYESTFRTPEYFCYDPETRKLEGWRLEDNDYRPIAANEQGWLWSAELELWLGVWEGPYLREQGCWLRFYDRDGNLVASEAETEHAHAEVERQRAEAERQRAESLEAELARLKALLAEKDKSPPTA